MITISIWWFLVYMMFVVLVGISAILRLLVRLNKKAHCYSFKYKEPRQGEWFAFVCPIEKDRWQVGWMDWYVIRVEGGNSYKKEELTLWIPLPTIYAKYIQAHGLDQGRRYENNKQTM